MKFSLRGNLFRSLPELTNMQLAVCPSFLKLCSFSKQRCANLMNSSRISWYLHQNFRYSLPQLGCIPPQVQLQSLQSSVTMKWFATILSHVWGHFLDSLILFTRSPFQSFTQFLIYFSTATESLSIPIFLTFNLLCPFMNMRSSSQFQLISMSPSTNLEARATLHRHLQCAGCAFPFPQTSTQHRFDRP